MLSNWHHRSIYGPNHSNRHITTSTNLALVTRAVAHVRILPVKATSGGVRLGARTLVVSDPARGAGRGVSYTAHGKLALEALNPLDLLVGRHDHSRDLALAKPRRLTRVPERRAHYWLLDGAVH